MTILDEVLASGRELTMFVSDFAGYLRNLLLAQSVEDPYEVLEFSKENMELIIHESHVADGETLIRYISIMSELLNRIRYASQKRLLIEVELIKLVRPQMQTDYSALLDRVRVLEEKLENGDFVSTKAAGTENTPASENTPEPDSFNAEELAKALPEDIVQVVNSWQQITGRMNGIDKLSGTMLATAVPIEENGKLHIVFKNDLDVRTMQFRNEMNGELQPSRIDVLKNQIAKITGKDLDITVGVDDGKTNLQKRDLRKVVKLAIRQID
jgi:DNA polymerase-3 subunit gamma/tau